MKSSVKTSVPRSFEILLVEDNPGDVRLTVEALKEGQVDAHLSVVPDGVEALDFLHRRGNHQQAIRPDLILMDLNLPRKDGRELLREIKATEGLRRIPVIVLTTSKAEDDVAMCHDLHANCYITKPVDIDEFIAIIKAIDAFWFQVVRLPAGNA